MTMGSTQGLGKRGRWWGIVTLVLALGLAQGGCRKRAGTGAAGKRDAGPGSCPPAEAIARLMTEPGRALRTDCVDYAPGIFWMGAALSYQPKTGAEPRLSLIYGGPPPAAFDLQSLPRDALTQIIKNNDDLRVSVRKASAQSQLIRVGVFGQHGGPARPEADELVVLLRLVAHAPPHVLWVGAGDQVRATPDGCINERTVDFDIPFGDRLEMTTVERARRAPGSASKQPCPGGAPSTQQTIGYKPTPLPPSRPLGVPAQR
jgi:hypothetical protein